MRRVAVIPVLLLAASTAPACSSEDGDPAPLPVDAGASDTGPPDAGPDDAAPPPVLSITFVEQRRFTIASEPGHMAFPAVTRLADGRILLVYRLGAGHVEPTGRIMKQFGDADADQWTAPEVLVDEAGIDDRDPSVVSLSDGRVLLSYFQYRRETIGGDTLALHEVFTGSSSDGAQSFTGFHQASAGAMQVVGASLDGDGLWVDGDGVPIIVTACSSPAVELSDRIAIPTYGGHTLNLGNLAAAPRSTLGLLGSTDGSGPWTSEPIAEGQASDVWLQEPALLPLTSGAWLVHARTADGVSPSSPGPLVQSVSTDQGASWSSWSSLPFVGHAPDLLQLDNGVVLSAVREINDAFTQEWVSFVHSLDDGQQWSEPARVVDCGAVECGYPSLLELDGDRLLMVYYAAGGASIDGVVFGFEVETAAAP